MSKERKPSTEAAVRETRPPTQGRAGREETAAGQRPLDEALAKGSGMYIVEHPLWNGRVKKGPRRSRAT